MAFTGAPLQVLKRDIGPRVLVLAVMLPFAILCFLGVYALGSSRSAASGRLGMEVTGAALVLLGGWIYVREQTRQVRLFAEGIEQRRWWRVTSIPWESVTAIHTCAIPPTYQPGRGLIGYAMYRIGEAVYARDDFLEDKRVRLKVQIVAPEGRIKFSKSDVGCVEAYRFANQQVNPRLLEEAQRQAQAGEIVRFGKLGVSSEGLYWGARGLLPYAEVEWFTVDKGVVCIMRLGETRPWADGYTRSVPNFQVAHDLYTWLLQTDGRATKQARRTDRR